MTGTGDMGPGTANNTAPAPHNRLCVCERVVNVVLRVPVEVRLRIRTSTLYSASLHCTDQGTSKTHTVHGYVKIRDNPV